MRIAFDLDGTLIPMPGSAMATEPRRLLPWLISRDPIRQGAPMLLRQLRGEGHELWVYTTSLRGPIRLGLWFATFGVQLDGIVNSARHSAVMAQHAIGCSKYPPAFGIDLLVDDAEGVSMEGERFGFSVLRLFGDDASWCAAVKNAAGGCLLSEPERFHSRLREEPIPRIAGRFRMPRSIWAMLPQVGGACQIRKLRRPQKTATRVSA
jgi:hypothetical protein